MTGIVLSGGKGTRIRARKSWLEVDGQPVIKTILARLAEVFPQLIIVTNVPSEYEALGARCIGDLLVGKGPLAGIYSGVTAAESEFSFLVANDMPFLDTRLISYMVDARDGFDAVVPRVGSLLEPLHALYSKRCLRAIEKHLRENDLRVQSFLGEVRTRYIEEEEIRKFGDPEAVFFNINRKEDMEAARLIRGRRRE